MEFNQRILMTEAINFIGANQCRAGDSTVVKRTFMVGDGASFD
jgi:hypothetical protein